MFSVLSLFSKIFQDCNCSMTSVLSEVYAEKFHTAVDLQGYGSCVYIRSHDMINLLYSTAKVMGKSAFSAPQSEMSGADLAVKMQQKISQEMYNVNLSSPVFIGDSEIVLRMIAKNDPADLPIFYATRVMEIAALMNPYNCFWCPGHLNPADLLTRSGTTLEQINSDFWLHGSFLL